MDPLNDPRFPNRPSHPDFWRLVEVINHLDGEATEGHKSLEDILGQDIDLDSLFYMADQRVLRSRIPNSPVLRYAALALYLDAFALGYHYAKEDE
jgi:hypothetical protein